MFGSPLSSTGEQDETVLCHAFTIWIWNSVTSFRDPLCCYLLLLQLKAVPDASGVKWGRLCTTKRRSAEDWHGYQGTCYRQVMMKSFSENKRFYFVLYLLKLGKYVESHFSARALPNVKSRYTVHHTSSTLRTILLPQKSIKTIQSFLLQNHPHHDARHQTRSERARRRPIPTTAMPCCPVCLQLPHHHARVCRRTRFEYLGPRSGYVDGCPL
jgi:hypothetical protein